MRVLVEVTGSTQVLGQEESSSKEDKRAFTHHALFENQLIQPPEMAYYKTDTRSLLSHFQLSPQWRLVDTDYFMKANPVLYSPPLSQSLYRESPL